MILDTVKIFEALNEAADALSKIPADKADQQQEQAYRLCIDALEVFKDEID